jgi:hypothetical protein
MRVSGFVVQIHAGSITLVSVDFVNLGGIVMSKRRISPRTIASRCWQTASMYQPAT